VRHFTQKRSPQYVRVSGTLFDYLGKQSFMEKEAAAHLMLLHEVSIHLRGITHDSEAPNGVFGKKPGLDSRYVADLMDAIHNTPIYISRPFCGNLEYIDMYYQPFDKKYNGRFSLVKKYYEILEGINT
jgi:hypothetical protein